MGGLEGRTPLPHDRHSYGAASKCSSRWYVEATGALAVDRADTHVAPIIVWARLAQNQVRVKKGYVPPDEQPKYVPPVVQQESKRQQQLQQPVPGADPANAAPRPMMSKAALKNEKRKAARAKEKEGNPVEEEIDKVAQLAAAIGMAPKVSAPVVMSKDEPTPPPPAPQVDAAPPQATNEKEPNEVEKKVRALRKKLRAVDDLIAKQASGAELNADQLSKVAARGELVAEISRWETLGDPEELSKEVKKLAKKLRQIEELEERATKGETLNADQLGKVAQKEKVTSEHSKLAELLGAKS